METSGICGVGAETPAARRPASKWRELMTRRGRERERRGGNSPVSKQCSLSGESQTAHNDDLMSLDWTENMRHMCDRLFAAEDRERRSQRTGKSQQISGNFQKMQQGNSVGSQSQTRPSWSVQKQVNNNCAQLAQWLAELAKIPPVAQADGQDGQRRQQRTQAATLETTNSACHEIDIDPQASRMNETQATPTTTTTTITRGTSTSRDCVCCAWASLHPHERARQLYEERNSDNLSALSASSSLLSQLLNSSLNQLIEIDNGSSTCCLCDSGQPCGIGGGGPALATATDDCNQQADLTGGRRAQPAAESRGPYAGSEIHLPESPLPPLTQQVVDERDLLVVTPMNGGRHHSAGQQQAAHQAQLRAAAISSDHLTRSIQNHRQVRHREDEEKRNPTKSRAQLGDAEQDETTRQVMQAQDSDDREQNGAPVRKGALNCDQFSVKSRASSSGGSARSCSTLTAAVTSDFERLRQQILEVHRRRRASRKRNPLASGGGRARQIENSRNHMLSRSGSEQVAADGGRQQQFVTFDKDATISQRRLQSEVAPELESMNNQDRGGGGNSADASADLLECCREICARTSSTTLTQAANVTPKVKSVAERAQEQRSISQNEHRPGHESDRVKSRDRSETKNKKKRLDALEGELINCSLIMGNGQQHDSLLEVSKCTQAPSGQRQDHSGSSSSSSSCMESPLSCFTSLAHHVQDQERSHLAVAAAAAPQECDRLLPPEDYAQAKHAAAASNKCLGKEGALLERRPFINHLNQRRPREQAEAAAAATQVFSSCDEQSRTASDAQSVGSISGSGGQSRGSPASGTSISSSEVSLGDSHSSCAIRVTTTSGESSEADCSCGLATSRAISNNVKQQVQAATSGQLQAANQEAAAAAESGRVARGPLEHATGNDEQRVAFSADCSAPNRKQEMGLIGSRQQQQQQQRKNEHRQRNLVTDSKGGSGRELKQYSKRQAAHDQRRIDLICNLSENDLLAAGENLDLNYQLVASELCAWESKFVHNHPSSSSAAAAPLSDLSSSSQAQTGRGGASKRAILSTHHDDHFSELLHSRQRGQTNHYITKHHQLTQAAQLYARNFVALPLHHQLVERSAKQEEHCAHEDGAQSGGGRSQPAGVIFSLDPSLEAADRASMVEATAQMVRVITSRESSRPSSRTSSLGAGTSKVPTTFTRQTNSPRPNNAIDATTLEPIYDVPSLSQIDINSQPNRCLSPDQKYPNVGVAGHSDLSSSQTSQLDKLGRPEITSQGRNTLNGQQAAIMEQEHNQRRPANGDGAERNSHAESLRDAGGQILFHQPRESGNTSLTLSSREEARSNFKSNFGHSSHVEKKFQLEKDDCDYEREQDDDDDDNKHKSSAAATAAGGREERQMTTKTATKKKVTCIQPSETITTTTFANSTNLNARQEAQESATIRHTRHGQSRRDKSQINNLLLLSRADQATSAPTSSCSCSTFCSDTTLIDGTTTVCSSSNSCSCSCSCCPRSSLISGHSSSILYLLRNRTRARTCSCDDDDDGDQSSNQSPGSLTQAYLRRHQHNHHSHHHHRRHRSRRQVLAFAPSGLRSPLRRNKRRRHHTSGPLSVSSGRLLRKKLRHMQRRRHAHRAHSSRTTDYGNNLRGGSHGGHAGRSQRESGGQLAPPTRPADANSYKVFANDDDEHERVRLRSLIRSEHATGAPSKLTASTKGGQRHPLAPLYVLDEEEEGELTEAGNQRRQPQESEFVGGGEQSRTNLSAYNQSQQPPDDGDRGGLIIAGQHARTRRRDQKLPPSELDKRENMRKRQVANLLHLDRDRALAGGATKINATATSPSRASREPASSSPNDDLNQHANGRARPRTRATSSSHCRTRASERSCGSSCSRLLAANHRPRHHHSIKSHYNTTTSQLDDELDRIRLLRRRQRKLIRRLLEVGVGQAQEISPSRAAGKQLKIEYLSRQVGAVARELKLQRRSYKSRVRHFYQQRRHLKRKSSQSSRRFNKPFAAASISHDTVRADQSERHRRRRTNEGYPAASERKRTTAASGLLRWRRLAQHRPISGGGGGGRPHAASSLNYSVASCCRRRHRRCSLSSSSCVSGSLVTSLSRGAHLRTGGHHWRRRRRRTRQHLGRNRRHYAQRHYGARPRRATETNDDSALRATTAAKANLNGRNMTTTAAASGAPGQAVTVGQLRNVQQALIASRHTIRDASSGGSRHITWRRSRHELNPTLTLVAAHERNRRQHGRSSSSGHRRRARKGARSERRGNNNPANYVHESKFNMDKFLVKRVDPSAKLMRQAASASRMETSRAHHPSVPFTWQLTNHCQCKHCCLVGTLVRMDLEGRRRQKTSKDFYGAVDEHPRHQRV